jgi:hypothetical protein
MRLRTMLALGGIPGPTFIFLAVVMCVASLASAEPGQPARILSTKLVDHLSGEMALYKVVLTERLATADLDDISRRIKRSAPKTKLLFISFFLDGMESDTWATSAFNPALDGFVVRVNEAATTTNPPSTLLPFAFGQ